MSTRLDLIEMHGKLVLQYHQPPLEATTIPAGYSRQVKKNGPRNGEEEEWHQKWRRRTVPEMQKFQKVSFIVFRKKEER